MNQVRVPFGELIRGVKRKVSELRVDEVVIVPEISQCWHGEVLVRAELVEDFVA